MSNVPSKTPPAELLLRRALRARYPLIYVVTPEEERCITLIGRAIDEELAPGTPVHHWSVATGLDRAPGSGPTDPATCDPQQALAEVVRGEGAAVYVFKDLHLWLGERAIVRWLREAYQAGLGRDRYLFLVSAAYRAPLELKKEIAVIDLPPPTLGELEPVLDRALQQNAGDADPPLLEATNRTAHLRSLQGLTCNEAQHVLNQVFTEHGVSASGLRAIQVEKARLIRKEGVLEFLPAEFGIDDVGGLLVLKDWLGKRRRLFLGDPEKLGDLMPRGLLMMGVSGCGKSLSVKAISSFWQQPLFRLDMNEIYSGAHGSPEESFTRALAAAEAFAPCILWMDEIEGGMTGYSAEHGGSTWRIFSHFLTWMQEKRAAVFVAATANRIDLLPAELLRKGRFDQIFFIDLPSEEERAEIFRVHLARRDADLTLFDLSILARGTRGWNGAEIEQCVVSAMIEAYAAEQPLGKEHVYQQLSAIVPLATTMSEQIKAIRSWAHDRALKAGKAGAA